MRARDRRPGLKAVYDVAELADLMGVSPRAIRYWLERAGVETIRSGRLIWVPVSALAAAFPAVYASLMIVAGARRAAAS